MASSSKGQITTPGSKINPSANMSVANNSKATGGIPGINYTPSKSSPIYSNQKYSGGSGGAKNKSSSSKGGNQLNQSYEQNIAADNVQIQSQAQQDQSRSLVRQNVLAAAKGVQSDQNYVYSTKLPYQQRGTSQSQGTPMSFDMPFSLSPTIYSRSTGSFLDRTTGQKIPTYEIRYNEGLLSGNKIVSDRRANKEEERYFKEQTSVLDSSALLPQPGKVGTAFRIAQQTAKKDLFLTNQAGAEVFAKGSQGFSYLNTGTSKNLNAFGINERNVNRFADFSTKPLFKINKEFGLTAQGTVEEFGNYIVNKPLYLAGGAAIGAATAGIGEFAVAGAGAYGGATAAAFTKLGIRVTGYGIGSLYGTSKVKQILEAPDSKSLGKVFGRTAAEGLSFYGGTKLGSQVVGQFDIGTKAVSLKELKKQPFKISTPSYIKNERGDIYAVVFGERISSSGKAKQTVEYTTLISKGGRPDRLGITESGSNILLEKGFEKYYGQTTFNRGKVTTKLTTKIFNKEFTTQSVVPFKAGFRATPLDITSLTIGNKNLRSVFPEGTSASAGNFYVTTKKGFKTSGFYSIAKETPEGISILGGRPTKALLGFKGIKLQGKVDYLGSVLRTGYPEVNLPKELGGTGSRPSSSGNGLQLDFKPSSILQEATGKTANAFIIKEAGAQGFKVAPSIYSGTGLYERTDLTSYLPKGGSKFSSRLIEGSSTRINPGLFNIQGLYSTKTNTRLFTPTATSITNLGKTNSALFTNSQSTQGQRNNLASAFGLGSSQIQEQGQSYKLDLPTASGLGFTYGGKFDFGFGFPDSQQFSGYAEPQRKKRGRKSPFNIAPSFTGIVGNFKITNPIKVSKTFGVTPFQTRGLLVGKKSKGSYFKLVDF